MARLHLLAAAGLLVAAAAPGHASAGADGVSAASMTVREKQPAVSDVR